MNKWCNITILPRPLPPPPLPLPQSTGPSLHMVSVSVRAFVCVFQWETLMSVKQFHLPVLFCAAADVASSDSQRRRRQWGNASTPRVHCKSSFVSACFKLFCLPAKWSRNNNMTMPPSPHRFSVFTPVTISEQEFLFCFILWLVNGKNQPTHEQSSVRSYIHRISSTSIKNNNISDSLNNKGLQRWHRMSCVCVLCVTMTFWDILRWLHWSLSRPEVQMVHPFSGCPCCCSLHLQPDRRIIESIMQQYHVGSIKSTPAEPEMGAS